MNIGPTPGSVDQVVAKSVIHAAWVCAFTADVGTPYSVVQISLPVSPAAFINARNDFTCW